MLSNKLRIQLENKTILVIQTLSYLVAAQRAHMIFPIIVAHIVAIHSCPLQVCNDVLLFHDSSSCRRQMIAVQLVCYN